ncbi:MAG: hypothetical protein NT166_24265 [Candidatus Aminicenantes bacterium]|nr:hypothetical protein [Candidatus Aminicenantes bacterium]
MSSILNKMGMAIDLEKRRRTKGTGRNAQYIKPKGTKKALSPSPENIKKVREEAEGQLKRYSLDEKFQKAIGETTLKKVVLIFNGTRLVYHGEIN